MCKNWSFNFLFRMLRLIFFGTTVVGYGFGYLACSVGDVVHNSEIECCPDVVQLVGEVL